LSLDFLSKILNFKESVKISEESDMGLLIFDQCKIHLLPSLIYFKLKLNKSARRITNGKPRTKTEGKIYTRTIAVLPSLNFGGKSSSSGRAKEDNGTLGN
jgi:hypothetical protein